MKTTRKTVCVGLLCGVLFGLAANGQTTIESWEYASDADMLAVWSPYLGSISLSPYVAAGSTGTNSLRLERTFSGTWDTEVLTKQPLAAPMTIAPSQYITFRIAGDPQFTNASFNQIYIYAYDSTNNFGRWGAAVPTGTNWQVMNIPANTIAAPWDSPGLPNLSDITQFKIFIYGQGDPAGPSFPATIYLDDLTVRQTPLIEFPPASPMRALIDNFESYADDTALTNFYGIINSPAATVTTPSLESPAPQGSKALKLAINFAPGLYPWGAVRSAEVAPFSLPTNAVVQLKFKGDPALAPVTDGGTVFYFSFYDAAGNAFHYSTAGAMITDSAWTSVKAPYNSFWTTATVDTGNLVRWRILVEAYTGTAESTGMSGTFYVDDIVVTVPPSLSIVKEGDVLKLRMDSLMPGTTYTLRQTTDFTQWTTTTIQATAASQTWTIPPGQKGFYQLYYTP